MPGASDEAAALFASQTPHLTHHPSDRSSSPSSASPSPSPPPGDHALTFPSSTSSYHLPKTQFTANTGPKGVIADAHSYEAAARQHRSFRRPANAVKSLFSTAAATASPRRRRSSKSRSRGSSPASADAGIDLEGSDEESFKKSWRERKMEEMKRGRAAEKGLVTRRLSPSQRRWGSVENVDPVGYLDAIERVGRDTIVVVCIYDDESEISGLVEDLLPSLARKHATTRFVKLHYLDAEMDVASVPAILAYKEGELFANLVGLIDEIPADKPLTSQTLEAVLQQHSVLF